MLGSVQDAEDALQDTLMAAWQGLAGFGEQASIRTWLYRIATNTCLNALRTARRRPPKAWDIPGIEPPEPTRLGNAVWLGPYPDSLLEGVDLPIGPEALYERAESISLAFVAALQLLPPRQLAVLVLRDVLGFPAREVAAMLDSTVAAVNSALLRARSTLALASPAPREAGSPPGPGPRREDDVAARFTRAYESADVPALVTLFTDDVFLSMPPMPLEYVGSALAGVFFQRLLVPGRRYTLVPTRANGQPGFGAYVLRPDGVRHATGLFAVTVSGDRISAMTRFESTEFAWFGLPLTLPGHDR